MQALKGNWEVGAIITDNAGQCGRARRILALRWPQIIFMFCFAHDINNLVKAVLKSTFRDVASQAAAAVNCLNSSSSKWLKRARQLMKNFYGRRLGLRSLCETRWNSMQGCFASLLRVQSSLQMLHRQYRGDADFPSNLLVLGDPVFWGELRNAEAVIAPLSYASHRLQRDENTVGDVVVSYRDIYHGFRQGTVRQGDLVKCVEARWLQCEQPLFMLGYALHPVYADASRALPNTKVSGIDRLPKIAVYYYRRLFQTEDISNIRMDMFAWMEGTFTRTKASEFVGSPCAYWRYLAMEKHDSLLPRLAMVVLSLAVNTATCERLFSELGMIHTAKRNRLHASKVLDIHTIAKHVRQRSRRHAAQDPRKKLLIRPDERPILREALGVMLTPSPDRSVTNDDDDSDDEDPGDGVNGEETMSLWSEYLDEVFQDDEIDTGYAEVGASEGQTQNITGDDEFEEIPAAVLHEFPEDNVPNFPQEGKLKGFRAQKATLEELFGYANVLHS